MSLRRIHLDAVGGIAGDMFCAALLDAFPELAERVRADVGAVIPILAERPFIETVCSNGLRALRFGVECEDAERQAMKMPSRYPALRHLIAMARLSFGTADEACAILDCLAEAEASVHGQALETVHFHEVGDWDSVMDVVAAGSIAAALKPVVWTVSALPCGGGLVKIAHGLLPVPAPATVELLKGFEFRDDGLTGERITPTGAAILRHLVSSGSEHRRAGRLVAAGTGAGTRQIPQMPNILRALVFEDTEMGAYDVVAISFEVDDMTGEEIAVAADRLRMLEGVLDLRLTQSSGKKGRPMQGFRLLVKPGYELGVENACFAETSTIGLRRRCEHRALLPRRFESRDGLRVKAVTRPDGCQTVKTESDDLVPVAGLAARRRRAADVQDRSS